jgi:hypothetical protein
MTFINQLTVTESTEKNSISIELIKAGYNYSELLQQAENIVFDRNNLEKDYSSLKKLREIKAKIEETKNPHYAAYKAFNDAKKSLVEPLEKCLEKKTKEFSDIAAQIKMENEQIAKENQRKSDIKTKIDTAILDYSNAIAACNSEQQLLDVERKLNLDLTRRNVYFEFLEDFKSRSESIRGLITAQKKIVKSLEGLKNETVKAIAIGADEKLLEIEEKKEDLEAQIEQNRINVMETAAGQTKSFSPIEQLVAVSLKARRTSWDYEVNDEATAYRWGMLRTEIDPKKAKEILANLKSNGTLADKKEFIYNGIRFFLKELF